MIDPEMCAMPDVMTVISSDRVIRERKGRMVSGASVWPMKIDAATLRLSAPLAPMTLLITSAKARTMICMIAQVIQDREERGDEDDRRKDLECEDHSDTGVLLADLAEDER